MCDVLKLKYKVGEIEFEAEGPAEVVEQQRVNFMNAVLPAAVEAMVRTPTVELLRKYADYFDVSMDYIFARCDDPHGKLYEAKPPVDANNPELRKFVEMCFDPESPMNEKLKEAMLKMLGEAKI